jgi:hypothetical protein
LFAGPARRRLTEIMTTAFHTGMIADQIGDTLLDVENQTAQIVI